jgi:hypothetical protein
MEAIPRASLIGAVAQLGERLNGIQEVRGSIPLGSTREINCLWRSVGDHSAAFEFWGFVRIWVTKNSLGQDFFLRSDWSARDANLHRQS